MQKYKTVSEFMEDLNSDKKAQVEMLRAVVKSVEPALTEHIKWNAPSYQLNGEDRITFNLMNKQNVTKLVFHMGATRKENKKESPVMQDYSGLIEWNSDIRGTVTFTDLEEINFNLASLTKVIQDWLSIPS